MARKAKKDATSAPEVKIGRPFTVGSDDEPSVPRSIRVPAWFDREVAAEAEAEGITIVAKYRWYLGLEE